MSSSSASPTHSIAYYIPPAKFEELDFQDFIDLCKEANIKVTELNDAFFDKHMHEKQAAPSFDLIVHTLSDIYSSEVDPSWLQLLQYIPLQKPSTIIVDPIEEVLPVLDRYEQNTILKKAAGNESLFRVPPFLRVLDEKIEEIVQALAQSNIQFPMICKPLKCDAPLKSHSHKIIFNAKHLEECERPYILQQFIAHDALLYRINMSKFSSPAAIELAKTTLVYSFTVGKEKLQIVERKSIRNLEDEQTHEVLAFSSYDVSAEGCDHHLSKQTKPPATALKPIDEAHLHRIAQVIQEEFRLNLISIDVLRIANSDAYAVIDVNYFPCYNGIDRPSTYIFQLCQRKLNSK